jgi:hypothetical protein
MLTESICAFLCILAIFLEGIPQNGPKISRKSKSYLELLWSPGRANRKRKVERVNKFSQQGDKQCRNELLQIDFWSQYSFDKACGSGLSITPCCKRKVIMFIHTWQDNHPEEKPVSSLHIVYNLHEKRRYKKLWIMSTVHTLGRFSIEWRTVMAEMVRRLNVYSLL